MGSTSMTGRQVNQIWQPAQGTPIPGDAPLLPDQRLWIGGDSNRPQTQLFRRSLDLAASPQSAALWIYAESVYALWVNGQFVARGPAYHHAPTRPVDSFDLTGLLVAGKNVVSVLVHAPGISLHAWIPSGEPGVMARLLIEQSDGSKQVIDTDDQWRATEESGWSTEVPRRNWALGYIEHVHADRAPLDWQAIAFDDSNWRTPEVHRGSRIPNVTYRPRPTPPLRYTFLPAPAPYAVYGIDEAPLPITGKDPIGTHGQALMDATWASLDLSDHVQREGNTLRIKGLSGPGGVIVCLDLGKEYAGHLVFEAVAPSRGRIDIGWSETVRDGRPELVRKGVSYADHLEARPGRNAWHPTAYNAVRYIALVFRGFEGDLELSNLGLISSEPDLPWENTFKSDSALANEVMELCFRTLRVGTQEAMIDCPSREQSTYIGDGVFTARWIAMTTGDTRFWSSLIDDQFSRPSPQGLVRSAVYSGRNDCLMDYSLLAIIGLRDYWLFTRDKARVQRWIGACRNILEFYESLRKPNGLIDAHWEPTRNISEWEPRYDPSYPNFETRQSQNLFIDHPGMGWHNIGEPGIDRHGCNTAITALDITTRRAMAELEALLGNDDAARELREKADKTAKIVEELCLDRERGYFIDGIHDGKRSGQVSEQTISWVMNARCCDDDTAREMLKRLLNEDDPAIARNGPYFWLYLFPELVRLGMTELAFEKLALWKPMLDQGATTLWETFGGGNDEHGMDSWCHAWGAPPLELLLTDIAGLPDLAFDPQAVVLRPRPDLLGRCQARIFTRSGPCTIAWTTEDGVVKFTGQLPEGVTGRVELPDGSAVPVSGSWRHEAVRS